MKERGMIFNAEMVRAILSGNKTQTRRIMKIQPRPSKTRPGDFWFSSKKLESMVHVSDFILGNSPIADCHLFFQEHCCPFGMVGDRIWVRETWSSDFANYYPNDRVWYAADNDRLRDIETIDGIRGIYSPESDVHVPFRWRPSIHMPRWASRILLEITSVRVERLNNISDSDALAEGVQSSQVSPAKYVFGSLWQSIYGADNPQSWQANPWVWVIEFKRVETSNEQ